MCGIAGALVFKTGGLADTVNEKNGFIFERYSSQELIATVDKSINANLVFVDDAYIVQSGKITEINKTDVANALHSQYAIIPQPKEGVIQLDFYVIDSPIKIF